VATSTTPDGLDLAGYDEAAAAGLDLTGRHATWGGDPWI
jgi:hypothetical protein